MFYRIYPLSRHGHVELPLEDFFASDEEAVGFADSFVDKLPHGFEVWQLERFVYRQRTGKAAWLLGRSPKVYHAPKVEKKYEAFYPSC
jgi:hypothetical protein